MYIDFLEDTKRTDDLDFVDYPINIHFGKLSTYIILRIYIPYNLGNLCVKIFSLTIYICMHLVSG